MNLATGILAASALGVVGRGELAALLLVPQFVGTLCMFGLPTAFIYNAKVDPVHAGRYFGGALLLTVPGTVLVSTVAWIVMPLWLGGHGAATVGLARLLLLSLPFSVALPLLTSVLDTYGRFGLGSAIQYLQPLGCAVLLVPLILSNLLTPALAAVAYVAPVLLTCSIAIWQAVRLLRPALNLAAPFRTPLLHFALRRYGFEALGTLAAFLDQLMVVHVLSAASIGAYAVALSISRILGVMQDAVFSVTFPNLAGRAIEEVMAMLGRALRASTALALIVGGVLVLLGPQVIAVLYGSGFSAAATPFRLLVAATIVQGVARLLSHAFTATGQPGPVTAIEALGIATTLLAMLVLMPSLGVDGAAAAVLLGSLGRLGCTMVSLKWVLRVRTPRLIVGRADLQWMIQR